MPVIAASLNADVKTYQSTVSWHLQSSEHHDDGTNRLASMTSYWCSIVTLGLGGTVVELSRQTQRTVIPDKKKKKPTNAAKYPVSRCDWTRRSWKKNKKTKRLKLSEMDDV